MHIDIQPIIRKADPNQQLILKIRELDCLYFFSINDEAYSVEFTEQELKDFQPNETVTHVIKMWENSIKARYEEYDKAIITKQHPYYGDNTPLTKQQLEAFKRSRDIAKAKMVPIQFIKIVR